VTATYSPFCVTAKVIKLVGLKNGGRVSPTNLITFAGTQNGELIIRFLHKSSILTNISLGTSVGCCKSIYFIIISRLFFIRVSKGN
jgi:hypothetical protein